MTSHNPSLWSHQIVQGVADRTSAGSGAPHVTDALRVVAVPSSLTALHMRELNQDLSHPKFPIGHRTDPGNAHTGSPDGLVLVLSIKALWPARHGSIEDKRLSGPDVGRLASACDVFCPDRAGLRGRGPLRAPSPGQLRAGLQRARRSSPA